MAENLWGDLPSGEDLRTPHSILLEQGQVLTKETRGILVGQVMRNSDANRFWSSLHIHAQALNDYSYHVVTLVYDIEMYPVTVSPPHPEPDTRAKNEGRVACATEGGVDLTTRETRDW